MGRAFRCAVGDGNAGRALGIAARSLKSSGSLYCGRSGCGLASPMADVVAFVEHLVLQEGRQHDEIPSPSVMSYLSPFSAHVLTSRIKDISFTDDSNPSLSSEESCELRYRRCISDRGRSANPARVRGSAAEEPASVG
jgi:hypothetical protein